MQIKIPENLVNKKFYYISFKQKQLSFMGGVISTHNRYIDKYVQKCPYLQNYHSKKEKDQLSA